MEWSDTAEVAETVILLLKTMGFRVTSRSSPWILSDWNLDLASVESLRWRGKLRKAFGLQITPPAINSFRCKITTIKTPETKKGERFRATAGTPYFEDSHMLSPKKSRTRLGRNKWESEEDNSAEAEDDSDDDHGYRPSRDQTAKDQIYHLSNDRDDQGGSQYLELRSHVSLDKIVQFHDRRYRSDDSLQWPKRFIYEMKGTHHVERFLLNCGDDDIMNMLYPLQLNDIHQEEAEMICAEMTDGTIDAEMTNATAAEMTSETYAEMIGEVIDAEKRQAVGQLSRDAELYDSEDSDGYSANGQDEDTESEDDTDYVDVGFTTHEVGQCELFRRYEKLAAFAKNNVDNDGNVRESEESDEGDSAMLSAAATRRYSDATTRPRVVKLLRGERLGWWSSQKFDRRVRMCAIVMGAVNDRRVKILLDTGANVSAVSSTLARKLRSKQYASRDQQIDIQGIGKDKVSTTHKALVKVTLGWEVVYEFEVWIIHHTRVDLILGIDFVIPAGIWLDLYNSAAKLPDEVVVPLLRYLKDTDDQTYRLQTADGPTEAVCLSDRATAEFKPRRKQPSDLAHEFLYAANIGVVSCTLPGGNLATAWNAAA
ncbi:Eukaryotic/viral aspartic protease [Phytophthora palmivora]|uniref:Eukaryotic/viral aspartic protease n=1 Tax=Phytophthora palmivora TaxID=4796 RepID=A0A2P4XK46_9STRA|nr:Eukaryotic/viral aspartic protease [Phytophthora palmivora]